MFIYHFDGERLFKLHSTLSFKTLTPLSPISLIAKKSIKKQIKIFTSYTRDNELLL